MESIQKKIKNLGGVDFLKAKKDLKFRNQIIQEYKLDQLIIDLIDEFGFGIFNETIEYTIIEKIPIAGRNGKCGIEGILGWGNNVHGINWNLEQLHEEDLTGYLPFASGYPGDCICISTVEPTKGKVFYWSHDEGDFYLIANSLEDFIESWEIAPEEDVDISGVVDFWIDDDL